MPQIGPNQPVGDAAALAAMTDERLILLFRLGNSDAFGELFRRFSSPVYGFFRRRLENPSRAEELAQETFVAVLRGIERYEPRATFRTYLYGIAMRILMAERRKSGRRESWFVPHFWPQGEQKGLKGRPRAKQTCPPLLTASWA
jgi:DNA-directed RNA polymerase specialized sigma24 family protein